MADERLIPAGIRDASNLALNELADRMGTVDLTPILIYDVDDVAESALPHLIEQFHIAGLEGARLAENATNKRELIKRSIALHRLKGTPAGIKQALSTIGLGDATIIERSGDLHYGGTGSFDGVYHYASTTGWAEYVLTVGRPITNDQAALTWDLCREFAPARCLLTAINYTQAALRYNGEKIYNGSYNHGVIA